MNLNRLDLNLLVALDALLTERSITRASERLHLSPSATSGVGTMRRPIWVSSSSAK
jgi:LysR family transcriptional regulator, nod-box dependent transcriptional activator